MRLVWLSSLSFFLTFGCGSEPPGNVSGGVPSITVMPSEVIADGNATASILVTVQDTAGQAVPELMVTLNASGDANTLTPSTGTTDAFGHFAATLSSTRAEQKTITAAIGGETVQATVTFIAGAPMRATSRFVAIPARADGTSLAWLEVIIQDALDNPVSGQPVTLSVSGTGNVLSPSNGVTGDDGVFRATLASTVAEVKTATATSGSMKLIAHVGFTSGRCDGTLLLSSVPTPVIPAFPALYDFNRDGKLDLFAAGVHLGNGDGTFQATAISASPISSYLVGDVNGDGILDVVDTNFSQAINGTVAVWLGKGDGTFQPPKSASVPPPYPYGIALGDFNGDGKSDLLTSNSNMPAITLLLSNGDGSFTAGNTYPVPQANGSILALADFNGDHKLDALLSTLHPGDGSLLVLGRGDGTLAAPVATGIELDFPLVADVDGDGALDLLNDDPSGAGALQILRGDNAGHFKLVNTIPGFSTAGVGDLDGDGRADLVVDNATNGMAVLLGNGNESFAPPLYLGRDYRGDVSVGDLNGDGHLDIATFDGDAVVLLGNGDGSLQMPAPQPGSASFLVTGDFNGDGIVDLAGSGATAASAFSAMLGQSDGTFGPPISTDDATGGLTSLIAGDFNGDHKIDLARTWNDVYHGIAGPTELDVYLSNGDGTFKSSFQFQYQNMSDLPLASGDLNNDGKLDLVVGQDLFFGTGNGTFSGPVHNAMNGTYLEVSDFNGDGRADLASVDGTNLYIALGNGDGTFQLEKSYPAGGQPLLIADFNGDGKKDFVSGHDLLLGNGDGSFQMPIPFTAPNTGLVASGDLNGDGKRDLVFADAYLSYLRGNGDGTFQAPIVYPSDQAFSLAVLDANRDGLDDVVVGSENGATGTQSIQLIFANGCL